MDINELESFKMSDAIKFHDELNPNLWNNDKLDPQVRKQLLLIAEDFITTLGIKDLAVKDITVSGSNAAYTYTPHSDLDLHVLVDFNELPNNEVYQELFNAKKIIYNDSHDITAHGVPVELYVQDTNLPVVSLGEYSVLNDKWIRIPKKQRATLDQEATRAKFDKLAELVELALQTRDPDRVAKTLDTIKRYRKAGLATGGEFSPENLAFKAIRKQGAIQDLYDLKNELHSEKLSIEEAASREDAILKIKKLRNLNGRTPNEVENVKQIVANLMKQWNIHPEEIGIKQPVDPLHAKIAKAAYQKTMAADKFKQEWDRFKKGIFAEEETDEDYHPNAKPRGPEFPPTMPAGTVRVDVSDVYDWYKLGQHISNMKGLGKHDFGKGPPSTILSFGDEDTEHEYIQDLEKTGLSTTDIDPVDPNQPKGMKRQKTDPTFNVNEAPIKLYTDPNYFGAEVGDYKASGPVVDIPANKLVGFEPDDKMNQPKSKANVKKIVSGLENGDKLPPILVRKYKNGYQVVDGHHRFWAYKLLGIKSIPAQIVPDEDIETVNETADRTAAVLKIQKYLNKKYGANLDLDGKLGPLTLKSINKFMPRAKKGLADEPNKTTAVQGKKLKEAERTFAPQITPLQQLVNDYGYFISTGTVHLEKNGETPEAQQQLLALVKRLQKDAKTFVGLDKTKMEANRDAILNHIHQMMQYAIPILKQYLPADKWEAKREPINRLLTAYNSARQINEASGYIPSEKEKNDPRFLMALTKDVRPDANKKNAKAFGWKVSRAGIPPQARPDGKITEDLMEEWKSFLSEDQQELFPGYDEQHRERRLSNWLAKSWGVQNGKPQTFYHATTKDFDTFNTSGTGFASVLGMSYEVERHGSFFAVDPKFAEDFIEDPNTGQVKEGGRVLPVHLSIQYPIDLRDNALSRMLSDDETREEFKAHDIDLNSIYNHMYELDRWELFDGPEGEEFVENLKKLGFDGAIINESIPNNSNARSGEVWVAFSPNQVKSIHNRGSFSPDDPRLMRENG